MGLPELYRGLLGITKYTFIPIATGACQFTKRCCFKASRLSFKVLSWDCPSYTVAYGHNEVHVHPNCHRRLSVYEAMLLQGFSHSYELKGTFTEQVRLISDAVPPPLAEGIASALAQALGYDYTHP